MVAWRSARTWRARGWIRVLAVALPVLLLPVAVWPSLLGTSVPAEPPPSRVAFLCMTYLVFAGVAWVAFRLGISVTRGTVHVTNAGRATVFGADDVIGLEPTARGIRFVIRGRDPVVGYAVPCPPPHPGQRPRWLDVAEAVAGEDPTRVAIIRGRTVASGVRSASGDAHTTAYRFTGAGLGPEVAICRRALSLLRPRLHEVYVTVGPTDDWPADLRNEVAEVTARVGPHRGRGARQRTRLDGRLPDLTLDLTLDQVRAPDEDGTRGGTPGGPPTDGTFTLLLRLAPWVVALEAMNLKGAPAGAVFDRCRDARFLLTDLEHEDLLATVVDSGLDQCALVLDRPRGS